MADGFQAYKYFLATKLHFTTDKYDVFESNGRVMASRESFEARRDRGLFEKLASKFKTERDLIQYLVANFAYGNANVIYSADSDEYYERWMARKQSMTRSFEMDVLTLGRWLEKEDKPFRHLFSTEDCSPPLLNMYLSKTITLETMSIINDIDPYLDEWEPLIMLWKDEFRIIRKVRKFIKYNPQMVQSKYNQLKKEFTEQDHGTHVHQ